MNLEVKKLWLEALRSGQYKQTNGCLKDEHGYCCLGVLTELYLSTEEANDNNVCFLQDYEGNFYFDSILGERESCVLPKEVIEWAGLNCSDPEVGEFVYNHNHFPLTLSRLNDGSTTHHIKQHSFGEIASVIEEKL